MTGAGSWPPEADPVLRGEARGQGRVYQATRDQLITEHHHHYQEAGAAVAVASPDSVRVARVDRPPRVLRNREELRAGLVAALAEGGAVHVVHGMGGTGKTSLAHWLFAEATRRGQVGLWVTASDRLSLRAAMLAVAADRGAQAGEVLAAFAGHRAAADLVWQYLDRSPQRWLLVMDNADDPELLAEGGWLRSSAAGTVLVTSRRAVAALWRTATTHPLGALPLEDAAQVLCDLAPESGTLDQARAVARSLGCLPLALDLAGSYLAHQILESWTMADYHDHLQDDATALIDQGAQLSQGPAEDRQLVSRTWQITLDSLSAQGLPEATTLLRLLSCWSADPLPLSVLASGAAAAGLDQLSPPLPAAQLEAALRALLANSLVSLQPSDPARPSAGARRLQVHAVVLDSVRAGIPPQDRRSYHRAATALLAAALPAPEAGRAPAGELLLLAPHVAALLRRGAQEVPPESIELAIRTAGSIHEAGDYQAAAALAETAGRLAQEIGGADAPAALSARRQQGDSLRRLGRLQESVQLLQDVLSRCEAVLGGDDPQTLQSALTLSLPLYLLGQRENGLALLERAVAGLRRVLGEQSPQALQGRALSLELLVDVGRVADFVHQGASTVADCEGFLGAGHPVTVVAYSNYAYGLLHAGDPPAAHAAAERAVQARIALHGPEHPLVYSAKLVLSWALMLCGRHEEAVLLMREAAEGRERLLGTGHPLSVRARILLVERLVAAGRPAEAERLFRENLADAERVSGADDPDLCRVRALFTR
ncbi:tetratricopeptide repeat protein [Kitasatospora nipponensis]|uniref:Tetratricopeptide repeat protein n=1 Tax=Kitasatospora nipponensis TaxID=258049 RepID=A0ABP4GPG7_9ACTN